MTHSAARARQLPPGLRIRPVPAMPKRKQGAVEAVAGAEIIDPVMRAKQRMKELAMKIGLEGRDLKPYVSWRGSIWRFSEFVSRKLMHSSHIKRLDIEMSLFSPFFGRPFKGNCCRFFSAVFFDQTVGMAVACSNQGESNWFRDHRSLAEKPWCQVAWTGERWVDEWNLHGIFSMVNRWNTKLFIYIEMTKVWIIEVVLVTLSPVRRILEIQRYIHLKPFWNTFEYHNIHEFHWGTVLSGTLICCTRWTVDKSDVAPKIRARRAFCLLASAKIVETWDSRFRHSYSSHPRSQKTKSFHEIDMQFPWSVLLLGTLKDVQRKRSLWMNMLELRVVVAIFSFWYVYGFSDLPQKNLTLDVPPWEFRSCKPSQLTLDWLMGSYYPIDPWNLFGKQPRSNSFLVSHLMSYSWLMCFFSVKFSPIDLFHRFRLLVFFLETPILLWTMIVEGSFLFVWSSSLCFVSLRHFNSGVPYNEHSIICKP